MLDAKLFRQELTQTAALLSKRGFNLDISSIKQMEDQRKELQIVTQSLQAERNTQSKAIGKAKGAGKDPGPLMEQVAQIGNTLKQNEQQLLELQHRLNDLYLGVPNLPHASVPHGHNETDNLEVRKYKEPPQFQFKPLDHVDIGVNLGLMDFETATKLTGSRFVILRGPLARLQRALIQFMLDTHTNEHGYQEAYVPFMVNSVSLQGTGQLPKFGDELFAIKSDPEYFLIPTAEVPVTNIFRDTIQESKALPCKIVAHTPCFRSEAGSYGKDTRGMIRQHQFEKVELVQIVAPETSYDALENLTQHAETILQKLDLPYRIVSLCSGDLGFSSAKTYDIEVWLPGQNTYREISSCSNFEDFQARRMQIRWRNPVSAKTELVHTLNGSGLAVGRTLVAILENYQNQDGSVTIPNALQSYMHGQILLKS